MAPLDLLVHAIQPASGHGGWHGGPTPIGALRGVGAAEAWWRPTARRKSIWMLTLHIAYWKYAMRRVLDGERARRLPARAVELAAAAGPSRCGAVGGGRRPAQAGARPAG